MRDTPSMRGVKVPQDQSAGRARTRATDASPGATDGCESSGTPHHLSPARIPDAAVRRSGPARLCRASRRTQSLRLPCFLYDWDLAFKEAAEIDVRIP
jgi:hypothetical protein